MLVRAREAVLMTQLQLGKCTVLNPGKSSGSHQFGDCVGD